MKLIAHRGYWNKDIVSNSFTSFQQAFSKSYGIETDFRDFNGRLVVSHDTPVENNFVEAEDFFSLAAQYPQLPLAINIKADGLQLLVKELLLKNDLTNYFVFDMSVPDMYRYYTNGLTYYTRKSEHETAPCLLDMAAGIWLDAFISEWYGAKEIESLLATGKKIAVVSAELHKRPHLPQWTLIKSMQENIGFQNLFLCTDFPDEAKQFFNL